LEKLVVGTPVALGEVAGGKIVGGGTDHCASRFADHFEKGLIASEITPFAVLVIHRTGNGLDQLTHEIELV
jgi:hypothetical protein